MRAQYARHPSRGSPAPRGDRPDVRHEHSEGDFERAGAEPASLQPSRRAAPECLPHEQAEIERAGMNEQPLQDVVMAPQVRAAEAAGVVHVGEGPLDVFAAASHDPLASRPAHAPAISVDRGLRLRRLRPVPSAALGLGDVRAHGDRLEIDHRLVTVIPLVGDDRSEHRWRRPRGMRGLDLCRGGDGGLDETRRVTDVGPVQRHRHERAGVQIDGMLGFVREVRAPVLHLRDLRVRIRRVLPVLVRRPLLPAPIKARERLAGRGLNARLGREPRQEFLVALAGVAPHDAAHRGVGLQRRRVDRHGAPLEQASRGETLLHPGEDGAMRFHVDQPPRARERRVIRGRGVEAEPHEATDRERIGRAPGNPALGVEPFEVAEQQQPKVPPRRQPGAPHHRRVERLTLFLGEPVEAGFVEDGVQPRVERMAGRDGELAGVVPFEEVTALLWSGERPDAARAADFRARLEAARGLPAPIEALLRALPRDCHPLDALRTAISLDAALDPDAADSGLEANLRKSFRLMARVPEVVAAWHRIRTGRAPVTAPPGGSHAAYVLRLLEGREPSEEVARVMDVALTLHADHEFNASTFAARVAVATLADLHAAVVAAIATLKGPRHGGANEDVLRMLQEIGNPAKAEAFVGQRLGARGTLSKAERANPRARVPGFGHRVYRVDDARARVLRGMAKTMAEATGRERLFEVAERGPWLPPS